MGVTSSTSRDLSQNDDLPNFDDYWEQIKPHPDSVIKDLRTKVFSEILMVNFYC